MADPLLVVGLPRSGTTWMAQALGAATGGGAYIHEPFNHGRHPERRHWFLRMASPVERSVADAVVDSELAAVLDEPPPVVKEVHAVFAMAALASSRRWPLVVAVRHPCAVATSWLELGWCDTGLAELLAQPALLDDALAATAGHLARCRGDVASELGAVWGATHLLLRSIVAPGTAWISHDAMCRAPYAVALRGLADLGLPTDDAGRAYLAQWLTTYDRPGVEQMNIFRVATDQPDRWRADLPADVAARVLAAAAPFDQLDLLEV